MGIPLKMCKKCEFWERDRSWSAWEGIKEMRYGDCGNPEYYKAFSWIKDTYGNELERQFPISKPDENFGCIFWKAGKTKGKKK